MSNTMILVIGTILAGFVTEYLWQNQWIGFFGAGLPLAAYYIYSEYKIMKETQERLKNKHKNKYR